MYYINPIEVRILTNQTHFQVYNDPLSETLAMMKKKKVTEMSDTQKQRICQSLIDRMRDAYEKDEDLVRREKPATCKLNLLPKLKKIVGVKSLQDFLLDNNILDVLNDWITPKSASSLTSLAVRREVYELLKSVLNPQVDHLKSSGIGKTIFALRKHKMEIQDNKVLLKEITEKWCRPIFSKSSDARSGVERETNDEIVDILVKRRQSSDSHTEKADFGNVLAGKEQSSLDAYARVRTPYSNGFMFMVQPNELKASSSSKHDEAIEVRDRGTGPERQESTKQKLAKRMKEMQSLQRKQNSRVAEVALTGRNKM